MPWQQPESWNGALLEYTRRLIGFRREHAALRQGSYLELHARDGVYAFARELHGECFIMVLNVNRRQTRLEVSTAALPGLRGEFRDLLSGLSASIDHQRLTGHDMPARSGALFRRMNRPAIS